MRDGGGRLKLKMNRYFNYYIIKIRAMREFKKLNKLKKGDKVAILSPSFAAPGRWPWVYELGLERIKEVFELEPVEYPTTRDLNAAIDQKIKDIHRAFEDSEIKAIITTLGGNIQVTYAHKLDFEIIKNNPKPFFGYSDNSHIINQLWLSGIPSYYGGAVMTQLGMQKNMDSFTVSYLERALFEEGEFEIGKSNDFTEVGLDWSDKSNLEKIREYNETPGWMWDGNIDVEGVTWGGCLESIDEMLRHDIEIPSLKDFERIVLFIETSEEIPTHDYVYRVTRALGERGILRKVKGFLVGRPKAWEFHKPQTLEERNEYRDKQFETIKDTFRRYNKESPIVGNIDFGHTDPQICLPVGRTIKINSYENKIWCEF